MLFTPLFDYFGIAHAAFEKHDLRFGQVFEKTEQGLFVAGFQRANVNFHAVIGGEVFIDFFECQFE